MLLGQRYLLGLPAHVINGVGVSLGVALIYFAGLALEDRHAALAASSGAVYASLADVPNPPGRTWRRVLTAAIIGTVVSLLVGALRAHPYALGLTIALIGFFSTLALAWGLRAGPISFVGVMTFVFSMAAPVARSPAVLLQSVAWVALGAGLYLLWAWFLARRLAPRYRTLALADVLRVTVLLLRTRAEMLANVSQGETDAPPLRAWIALDSVLDEKLQAARDHLFAARDSDWTKRQTALLLLAIDLRDTLLLSQLDLEILGQDIPGRRVRQALVDNYAALSDALEQIHRAIAQRLPLAELADRVSALGSLSEEGVFAKSDERHRLLPMLVDRSRHMFDDLGRMHALAQGAAPGKILAHDQLQLFVSVEGWPLAALRPHLNPSSPVMRHALRAAAAFAAAYFIGLALPWASHPHWLVLSVAVVLRGSLEQTLMRRNLRVAGTVAGCLVVLALSHLATAWLSTGVYLTATGLAHAFSVARYFVTATAATVMALLQDHLANPLGGFAVAERLADTAIGALLAWAFSYVLPSWERQSLPRLLIRLTRALDAMARQAIRMPEDSGTDVGVRLARREVYEALRAIAAAAQRSRVEPKAVRLPAQSFADLLAHSHAFMAHMAAVRLLLARRGHDLDRSKAQLALNQTREKIEQLMRRPPAATSADSQVVDAALVELPANAPAVALMPWLDRRLQVACLEAASTARAAAALHATADSPT